ncbi:MAG: hypothetical protein IPM16_15330 [Chloroflexi bacterium]|nr:hypothetical protein [Chloroflexota bacterium]
MSAARTLPTSSPRRPGVNLWAEWARLEIATARRTVQPSPLKNLHGTLLVCLAKQEWPDLNTYNAPEVVWRIHKSHHAGVDHRR